MLFRKEYSLDCFTENKIVLRVDKEYNIFMGRFESEKEYGFQKEITISERNFIESFLYCLQNDLLCFVNRTDIIENGGNEILKVIEFGKKELKFEDKSREYFSHLILACICCEEENTAYLESLENYENIENYNFEEVEISEIKQKFPNWENEENVLLFLIGLYEETLFNYSMNEEYQYIVKLLIEKFKNKYFCLKYFENLQEEKDRLKEKNIDNYYNLIYLSSPLEIEEKHINDLIQTRKNVRSNGDEVEYNLFDAMCMRKELNRLREQIKDLETQILYTPGNSGYKESEKNFNDVVNKKEK